MDYITIIIGVICTKTLVYLQTIRIIRLITILFGFVAQIVFFACTMQRGKSRGVGHGTYRGPPTESKGDTAPDPPPRAASLPAPTDATSGSTATAADGRQTTDGNKDGKFITVSSHRHPRKPVAALQFRTRGRLATSMKQPDSIQLYDWSIHNYPERVRSNGTMINMIDDQLKFSPTDIHAVRTLRTDLGKYSCPFCEDSEYVFTDFGPWEELPLRIDGIYVTITALHRHVLGYHYPYVKYLA